MHKSTQNIVKAIVGDRLLLAESGQLITHFNCPNGRLGVFALGASTFQNTAPY